MKDILSISVFEKTQENISIFKNTNSLINGSRYLMSIRPDDIMLKIYGVNEITSWNIISSLNLLFSIKDVIIKDLEEHKLLMEWKKSEWKKKIEEDELLKVLREVRNHNIHIEVWDNTVKNYRGKIGSKALDNLKEVDLGDNVFFKPIDFSNMEKLKNVKIHGAINSQDIEWFNIQSSMYSASDLICEARERYAYYISKFINEEIQNK